MWGLMEGCRNATGREGVEGMGVADKRVAGRK